MVLGGIVGCGTGWIREVRLTTDCTYFSNHIMCSALLSIYVCSYQLVQCRNNLVSEGLTEADPGLHPPHIFTGDSSGGHFSQYQYCDLLYGPLKAIIDNPKGLQAACQKRDGWYPNRTTANIRQIIRKRWLEVLQAANPSAYSRVLELRKARSQQAEEGEDAEEEEDAEEDEAEEFDYYDEE